MRILTCSEADEAAAGPEASPEVLMRRAGYAVAQFCASRFKFSSACVICGRGKNGGAGLVAAEALHRVAETVSVIMLAKRVDEFPPEVAACLSADIDPLWIADEADLANAAAQQALGADLIVDAMMGTGFKPPLRSVVAAAVAAVNDAPGTIVSVDVPAGVDADDKTPLRATGGNVVFPHGVIALIAPKPVHVFGHLTAGPIAVSELGVQPAFVPSAAEINVLAGREVGMALAPVPDERTERPFGGFGHLLVVAGSPGQEGTAALVGMAALNAGAGRVTVACLKSIQRTVAGFRAALSTQALPETDQGTIAAVPSDRISALLAGKDAVVIGPGLSRNPATGAFVRRLANMCELPLIVDGDGLDAFEGRFAELQRLEKTPFLVLLPHAAQGARLTGCSVNDIRSDTVTAARRIADPTGACVVLKARRSVVAGASDEVWINVSANAVLAKAGVDELLCGIVGAVLARHFDPDADAAARTFERVLLNDMRVAAAVHLHGLAGDIACHALHENVVGATDVLGIVLLNLWATWCVPCRKEMPWLDRLQPKLGGAGFTVLPLSIDHRGRDVVARFYRELGLNSVGIYVDTSANVTYAVNAVGMPTTLLVDGQGRELGRVVGPAEWDSAAMLSRLASYLEAHDRGARADAHTE